MSIIDTIQASEYIYSTFTKWGLKKYTCDVEYFTEEPLDDLSFVVCSILQMHDGVYDKRELGVLLGFSLSDYQLEGEYITQVSDLDFRLRYGYKKGFEIFCNITEY